MNKYLIPTIGVLCIGIIMLVGLGRYSILDTESLFGWGRFKPFPEEIRQKYDTSIEKVDALIIKEGIGEVNSRSEIFNLENYLGIIVIGVLPYLNRNDPNDPFIKDVELLAEDIRKNIETNRYYWRN